MSDLPDPFAGAMTRLYSDPQPIQVAMSKGEAWCLCCTIQLACRHPRFTGPTRTVAEALAHQILAVLTANDQELRKLAAMGWAPQFDDEAPPGGGA